MKTVYSILVCALSLLFAQGIASAQNNDNGEGSKIEITNGTEEQLTITGPMLIEVNTVNVYCFNKLYNYSGPGYSYQWTLLCADDPTISPFYMGYNTGSSCSFICYEPVNLFLWLDVKYCNITIDHAETMVTVLPAGSL